ncbi:MAG: beta-lactamase family protein [Gammaproteobacteria bacterium]|nr:beta-lactamase family protein [Gammaproteobacteria bacterium]
MTIQRITFSVWLVLLISACSSNPVKITGGSNDGYQKLRIDLDKNIPRVIDKHDLASMVVLVVDDQDVVYANGFGYANSEQNRITTPDTAYRIGSISKLFTAIAIMQLHEQGKLDIDQPLKRYLPEFSINTPYGVESITLRSMLSHYSGLPSDYVKGFTDYEAEQTMLEALSVDHVAYKAEEVHAYSNLAYGILGLVIERVSGLSYPEYLEKHLFAPLGMSNASLGNTVQDNFAVTFLDDEVMQPVEIRDRAAGDLRMSANDLGLFAKEMLKYTHAGNKTTPKLLSRTSLLEMWEPQYKDAPVDSGFEMGLGWILSYPNKTLGNMTDLVWHNGGTFHYHSALLLSREHKIAVIVFSNFADTNESVTGEVAENTLLSAIRSKNGYQPEPYLPKSRATKHFSSEQANLLTGRYLSSEIGEFTVERDGDTLFARFDGQKAYLVPMDDGSVGVKFRLFGLIPFTPAEIKDLRFNLVNYDNTQVVKVVNGGPAIGQKAQQKTLPDSIEKYLGNYRITNPDSWPLGMNTKGLTISKANGYLRVDIITDEEPQIGYLEVVSDGYAKLIGYGRSKGNAVLFDVNDQGIPTVYYSGLRFEKSD